MKRGVLAALLGAAVVATLVTAAAASPVVGVTDDATKWADDGGASLFGVMRDLGLAENRIVVYWNPAQPGTIQEKTLLDRALPTAAAAGIRVTFAVYPRDPLVFAADTEGRVALFAAYVKLLALTYPQVKTFVLLNEPNEAFFQAPQHGPGGEIVSADVAFRAVAGAYDALKALDPGITVVGLGLSPEGNDTTSTSPVRFLQALGDAYRRSGRTAPIMDELGYHLYPRDASRQDQGFRFDWPNAGAGDLDRIKQAVWDAFAGTAQPVFPEAGDFGGLRLRLDEIGWQAAVPPSSAGAYRGVENVPVTDERRQAQIYAALVRTLGCDPAVSALMFFHLLDDGDLRGFQSGLLRADGSPRPAAEAVHAAVAAPDCATARSWAHATGVAGASAYFDAGSTAFTATAAEDAVATAALLRVAGPLTPAQAARLLRTRDPAVFALDRERVRAGVRTRFGLPDPGPGTYALVVRMTAVANAQRTTTLVSGVFRIDG